MEHMNLFENSIYGTMGISAQIDDLVNFFIANRNVRIPLNDINEILRTKVLTSTPVSDIFTTALRESQINKIFTAVNAVDGTSVPEAITAPYITLDMLQLGTYDKKAYSALSTLPEFKDRIIINLTHLLKRKPDNSVSDVNELHSLYVRGLLVRSYYNSHDWLSPELVRYLSKSYSMTIGSNIGRIYDLAYNDQIIIMTILTAYFHQLCNSSVDDNQWSPTIAGCSYLGNRLQIVEILEQMKEELNGTKMSLMDVCTLIQNLGPSRMSKFDIRKFYSITQSLGTTGLIAMIAVEYPPYWTHQLLSALSGVKSGLYFAMKKNEKLINEGKDFATNLVRSAKFLPLL